MPSMFEFTNENDQVEFDQINARLLAVTNKVISLGDSFKEDTVENFELQEEGSELLADMINHLASCLERDTIKVVTYGDDDGDA